MKAQTLKDHIIQVLNSAMDLMGSVKDRPSMRIEYAREEKFGDYACTIAMDKRWREAYAELNPEYKNPKKFAEDIRKTLLETEGLRENFSSVDVAGPGFLNLFVSPDLLFKIVREANESKRKYGKTEKENPRNIIFEFVSANPTGPLNVVSARAAALGDSCCNLLEAAGEKVHREYYVNDYGNQVRLLGISCLLRYLESEGALLKFAKKGSDDTYSYNDESGIPFPAEGYHGEYLKDVADATLKADSSLNLPRDIIEKLKSVSKSKDAPLTIVDDFELGDTAEKFGLGAVSFFLETQKRDLERFRVNFDEFFRERKLHQSGEVMGAVDALGSHLKTEDGKQLFTSTDFGDDKDRVIIRDDGRPTYLLADIAYHKNKMERGFTNIFNIWGPDHHGYIKRLEGAMLAMGYPDEAFRVLVAQQVNLLENGQPIVMSKRTGKFITMETLIEEIPVDVTRYFFVMRSFESHLDFDFSEAKDTSEKNPYYYVAYAHARIRSIFQKAEERGLRPMPDDMWTPENLAKVELTPERRRLLWYVARYPEEIRDAAETLEPHRVITYLYSIASALSKFYAPRENRIIEQDEITAGILLRILDGVAICLKNGLGLMGMEAPDRLTREESE